ncbi:hypothetical protein SEA_STEPHIG9_93 [Mycobacterium phage Stephig9]|uniref:Uncharacterized protein n=1 Tax=Mycobacterium phage Stephig9 TaxID=2591224 RepID=A0A514DHE1_9CAUD|nr:hypothetical protein SEA_STEPHIG9_93 [Mycobacterium phage Stephig9]
MHYSWQDIMDKSRDLGEGWRRTDLVLGEEDTAHSALSTKWDFQGPGEVTYMIHASGWTVHPSGTLSRAYIT